MNSENEDEWDFFNGDICIRRDPVSRIPVSIDIDSGSTISGRLSTLGISADGDKIRVHSITVSADEVVKRDLCEFCPQIYLYPPQPFS